MRGRNGWWLVAPLAALALLAAACSGGSEAADPGAGTATPTPTSTPTPTPSEPPGDDDTTPPGGLRLLEGVFESGFEHSAFYPGLDCVAVAEEPYWLSWLPESRFDERMQELTGVYPFAEPGVLAFRVSVRGELSAEGRYGHLGQYPRELIVHELIGAAVVSACVGDGSTASDDADPGGDSDPPSHASPPPVSASANGAHVALGLGSYCWTQPGGPGLCADSFGYITNVEPLAVSPGDLISLSSDLDLGAATQIHVQAVPAGTPLESGPDWLAWQPGQPSIPLDIIFGPEGPVLPVNLEPGRYVVTLFVAVAQGDVLYGLYIEVKTSTPVAHRR